MRGKERKEVTCMSAQTLSMVWTVLTPFQCPKPSHGPTWLWDTFDISSPRIPIALQHPFILTLNCLDCSIKSKKLGHPCSFPFACQSPTHALRLSSGITSTKIPTSSCPSFTIPSMLHKHLGYPLISVVSTAKRWPINMSHWVASCSDSGILS